MAAPLTSARAAPAAGSSSARVRSVIAARWPVLAAALLGVTLLYGVGLAQPHVAHNAAHDTRHATGFPCH